jgi:hypothetical protein
LALPASARVEREAFIALMQVRHPVDGSLVNDQQRTAAGIGVLTAHLLARLAAGPASLNIGRVRDVGLKGTA